MGRWAVVEGGVVTGMVAWDGVSPWSPASGEPVEVPAGVRAGIGWAWDGSEFIGPAPDPLSWEDVRAVRDGLLAASDWTQVADAPVDATAWAAYRQQLRDIPQTFDSPDDVVWPAAP